MVFVIFLTIIYKNDYIVFHLVDKLNKNTDNKFHLSYIRNQSIKYINELNPFVGKFALKFQNIPEINIQLPKKSILAYPETILLNFLHDQIQLLKISFFQKTGFDEKLCCRLRIF